MEYVYFIIVNKDIVFRKISPSQFIGQFLQSRYSYVEFNTPFICHLLFNVYAQYLSTQRLIPRSQRKAMPKMRKSGPTFKTLVRNN